MRTVLIQLAPLALIALALLGWEVAVSVTGTPDYILPGPARVWSQLVKDWPLLIEALGRTLWVTLLALGWAALGGVALALVFALWPVVERAAFPLAVVLQVTPLVAIAPLILIYVDDRTVALVLCAWIVAFFPVLSNTAIGLRSADRGLHELFTLYGASRWQRLTQLMLPAALPYFLAGLRIAGGLALIGAIVAEFVAGTAGGGGGIATRIFEASYRLNIPRMYAALALIALAGVALFLATGALQWLLLRRWHESADARR